MASVVLTPSSYDSSLSTYDSVNSSYPLSNGYSNADSDTYAEINTVKGTQATTMLTIKFDMSKVPAGATIDSVSCRIKARISNSSPYVLTGSAQLYWGSTAMGGDVGLGTTATTYTFNDVGYWDRDRLNTLSLVITCTRGIMGGSNTQTLRFYGADLTVNYTGGGSSGPKLSTKVNGSWVNVSKVYKKINGSWIEQSDLASLFSTSTNYVKG